jgi:hypothetical protein
MSGSPWSIHQYYQRRFQIFFTIFKENIETLVGNNFKIPLRAEFGSKYRRRKLKKEKKTSWPVLNENIIDPFFDISNITDAPKIEKNITEGDIENILVRPVILNTKIAAEDGEDVLPTPDKPFEHQNNEKVFHKSQIKWLNNSVDISDDTIKEVLEAKERDVEDIAEGRTLEIVLPEESENNFNYSDDITKERTNSQEIMNYTDAIGKEVAEEPESMNYSDEESNDSGKEMSENIRVLFSPPSSPYLSHIPIYLELPTNECPKFCIQVNVEITRMAKQIRTRCRSSVLCNKSNRKRR